MVLGAHKERRILLENNPHLTNWVPIAIPITSFIMTPAPFGHPLFSSAPFTLPLIMKFYDSLSGFTCPPSHIMSRSRANRKFPQLDKDHALYYQVFYEGQHNDTRTNTYLALTAAEHGCTVANYVEMTNVITGEDGKAIGIKCLDKISGKSFDVYSKAIVFAGGPFTDHLRRIEDPNCKPAINAAAGTHIVLPGYYSPNGIGMLDVNTSDGRFLFFLPWEGFTLIGTTDRKGPVSSYHGPPEDEIDWLLKEVQKYLAIPVRREDVLSAWQGFRPLASDPNAQPGDPISRDHIISTNPTTGITFITGGKWVTYREMAEDVIDKVVNYIILVTKLDHALQINWCYVVEKDIIAISPLILFKNMAFLKLKRSI
jgi:glycerol-3-phosphate dehydrogenase